MTTVVSAPASDLLDLYHQIMKEKNKPVTSADLTEISRTPNGEMVMTGMLKESLDRQQFLLKKMEEDKRDSNSYDEEDADDEKEDDQESDSESSDDETIVDVEAILSQLAKAAMCQAMRNLLPQVKWCKVADVVSMDTAMKIVELIFLVQQMRTRDGSVRFIGHVLSRPYSNTEKGCVEISRKTATLVELTPIKDTLALLFENLSQSTEMFEMPVVVCNFTIGAAGSKSLNLAPVAKNCVAASPYRDGSMPISRGAYDPGVHRLTHPSIVRGRDKTLRPVLFIDCPNHLYRGDVVTLKTAWNLIDDSNTPNFSSEWQKVPLCARDIGDEQDGLRVKVSDKNESELTTNEPEDECFDGQVFYIQVIDVNGNNTVAEQRKLAAAKIVHFLVNNTTNAEDKLWETLMDSDKTLV
jgi:hypothetical protein